MIGVIILRIKKEKKMFQQKNSITKIKIIYIYIYNYRLLVYTSIFDSLKKFFFFF